MPAGNRLLVPAARGRLQELKYAIAATTGPLPEPVRDEAEFRRQMDRMKFEVAADLGIPLRQGYNGDLTSRQAGRIGGRLGGPIGGQMVRALIHQAERTLAEDTRQL